MKKVAIVTGASRGIGRAVAKRLAQDGFAVVVNYLSNAAEANEVVAELKGIGALPSPFKQMCRALLTSSGSSMKPVRNSAASTLWFTTRASCHCRPLAR